MSLRTLAYLASGIMFVIVILVIVKIVDKPSVDLTEVVTPATGPQINKQDALYGEITATNQIVNFGYAGCKNCEQVEESARNIIDGGADAVLVWEDFPNTSLSSESLSSAIAMRCAQEQDAFWTYQPYLFAAVNPTEETYLQIAEQLELRTGKFERCMKNGKGAELVQASIEEGNALGITATPTIFINGIRYTGLLTQREIQTLLIEP